MNLSDAICFLKGRIKFIDKEGNILGTPLQGQVIIYFGENEKMFYHNFNAIGICMKKI